MTSIGSSAFYSCTDLRLADLPVSVTTVGDYAFAYCDDLRYVILSNPNCTIGSDAFKNSDKVALACDLNSLATVYAIENNIEYYAAEGDAAGVEGVLNREATYYLADTNSMESNGYITLTVDYNVPDSTWAELSNRKVGIKIPTGTELVENSLRLDGEICTSYEYDDDQLKLIIPVSKSVGTIKFSAKVVEDRDIRSYALLTYRRGNSNKQEIIGVIDESVDMFTLYAEKLTSSRKVRVEGVAPAESDVGIYVDGTLQTTVKSNKVGAYMADITLAGTSAEQMYTITANCTTLEGDILTATHTVKYQQEAPKLTGLKFYADGAQVVDLYDSAQKGIKPAIPQPSSSHPYKFVATFENPESIENLYVTSVRSNIKKSIPAVYDEASGAFVAEGYFDETNKLYVPGTLGLEYNLKHEEMLVGQDVNWEEWHGYLKEGFADNVSVESVATSIGSVGTIDFSGVSEALAEVALDYSIDLYDEATGGSLSDLKSMVGVVEKIYGYVIPGVDDSRYYMLLDLRDPETVSMIVSDLSDMGNKAVQFKLSATEFGEAVGDMSYMDFYDFADKLSGFTTAAGVVYNAFGIYGDYDELCNEIMESSTITDKSGALKKAEELRDDQMAFMLLTTMLPIVIASGPMAGPTMLLTAMISSMVAMSDIFWQLRITEIKGESYKIKWYNIDPSGYVYDVVTNERLQGVTATAYCIEYDDTDTFWDSVPAKTEYGEVWDALAYNQANPLTTDAEGRYAWDVPEGWWRVKYEKDGYETTWSEWLPVPPPQTEVNIGMTPLETAEPTATPIPDISDELEINNTSSAIVPATIAAPVGGWVEGDNTFTVVCAKPCFAAISYDGGQTYQRLSASQTANGYSFTAEDMTADTILAVGYVGDINGDGTISNADATRLAAIYAGKTNPTSALMGLICDVNNDGQITNADITGLRANYAGKKQLSW